MGVDLGWLQEADVLFQDGVFVQGAWRKRAHHNLTHSFQIRNLNHVLGAAHFLLLGGLLVDRRLLRGQLLLLLLQVL